jgi:hypothetical protein
MTALTDIAREVGARQAEQDFAFLGRVYELFLSEPITSAFREADDGPEGEPPPADPDLLMAVQADRFMLMRRVRELRAHWQSELPLDAIRAPSEQGEETQ